ncbi:hypothetical protein RRG08_013706, partial [Elysia crispata]
PIIASHCAHAIPCLSIHYILIRIIEKVISLDVMELQRNG